MKNLLGLIAVLAITAGSISANAQMRGSNLVRGILGFSSSALNIGADYEMKHSGSINLGGYFFLGTDDKDNGVPQVLAVGVFAPVHFLSEDLVDLYFAPGAGFAKIDNNVHDKTTFGPSVKLGADFKVAPRVKVGLQYMVITNWMSDKLDSQYSYTNAAVAFSF